MMHLNPSKRPTASECLMHPYFNPLLPNKDMKVSDNIMNKSQDMIKIRKESKLSIKIASKEHNTSSNSHSWYKNENLGNFRSEPTTTKLLNRIKARISFCKNQYNLPVITKKKTLTILYRKKRPTCHSPEIRIIKEDGSFVQTNNNSKPLVQFSPYHNTPFRVATFQKKSLH